jgi:hypothetical protein
MSLSSAIRAGLIALTVTGAALATAYADSGGIRFNVIKAGFVVGGSGGSGTLMFHGRIYPLSIGGISYGFTFGASSTDFVGEVSNIRTPTDVNGVYGAASAGVALGAHQPKRRDTDALRPPSRTDRRRGSQRARDHATLV